MQMDGRETLQYTNAHKQKCAKLRQTHIEHTTQLKVSHNLSIKQRVYYTLDYSHSQHTIW